MDKLIAIAADSRKRVKIVPFVYADGQLEEKVGYDLISELFWSKEPEVTFIPSIPRVYPVHFFCEKFNTEALLVVFPWHHKEAISKAYIIATTDIVALRRTLNNFF